MSPVAQKRACRRDARQCLKLAAQAERERNAEAAQRWRDWAACFLRMEYREPRAC